MSALPLALLFAAGVVVDEPVALDEVLGMTELVVTVQLDSPASTPVEIPVPSTKTPAKKPCGTYASAVYTGKVVDVAHPAQGGPVEAGDRIVVFPANTNDLLGITRLACEEGASRSVSFPSYAGAAPKDGARVTALLRWSRGIGWTEAVAGSWLASPLTTAQLKRARSFDVKSFDAKSHQINDAMCVVDADCTRTKIECSASPPCAGAGDPFARLAASRFRAQCHESRGRLPLPCSASPVENAPVVCHQMRCMDPDVASGAAQRREQKRDEQLREFRYLSQ